MMAQCQTCYGCGEDVHAPLDGVPCPECHGSGIVSCCDTAGAQYMKPEDYWADVEKALPDK